jgi:pSer/pThr/pTyr-binding forkhead associated (FHA) protein
MKDTGSMHGTLVNGTKVQSDKESVLEQGQTFVFGTEVHTTRDDDVHYPPQFRVASLDIIRYVHQHHPIKQF